ncbi:hypothetical protein QTO34_008174, partial [Cnephaeus nilssonii]
MEYEKRIWQQKGGTFDPDRQIWLGPNQKPILPVGAQLPVLQHVHELTHWGPEKMISRSKQYYWKPSPTVAHKVINTCEEGRGGALLSQKPGSRLASAAVVVGASPDSVEALWRGGGSVERSQELQKGAKLQRSKQAVGRRREERRRGRGRRKLSRRAGGEGVEQAGLGEKGRGQGRREERRRGRGRRKQSGLAEKLEKQGGCGEGGAGEKGGAEAGSGEEGRGAGLGRRKAAGRQRGGGKKGGRRRGQEEEGGGWREVEAGGGGDRGAGDKG